MSLLSLPFQQLLLNFRFRGKLPDMTLAALHVVLYVNNAIRLNFMLTTHSADIRT